MGQPHPQGLRGRPLALPVLSVAHARGLVHHPAQSDPPHPRPPRPPRPESRAAATLAARRSSDVGATPRPDVASPDTADVWPQRPQPGAPPAPRPPLTPSRTRKIGHGPRKIAPCDLHHRRHPRCGRRTLPYRPLPPPVVAAENQSSYPPLPRPRRTAAATGAQTAARATAAGLSTRCGSSRSRPL
jgi:hypothetical protein